MKFKGPFSHISLLLVILFFLLATTATAENNDTEKNDPEKKNDAAADDAGEEDDTPEAVASPPQIQNQLQRDEEVDPTRLRFEAKMKDYEKESVTKTDCAPTETIKTLKFLSLKLEDELRKGAGDKGMDCSHRRTDVKKLREFLNSKGFLDDPGSLRFVNDQDHQIRIKCSDNGDDDKKYRWMVFGDKGFPSEPYVNMELNVQRPDSKNYYRKYFCYSIDRKCSHTSYVITRPLPIMEFPLHALEGDQNEEFKFFCHISPCTNGKCKGKKVNAQGPFEFYWRIPRKAVEVEKGNNMKELEEEYKCKTGNEEDERDEGFHTEAKPIYIQVDVTGQAPVKNVKKVMGMEFEGINNEGLPGIQLKFPKVIKKDHSGPYECVIIDNNGVPSTPTLKSLHDDIRYKGKSVLHVRQVIMVIIPTVIVIAIIILMLIIWIVYRNHDTQENDDGTPYQKEESVAPEKTPPPTANAEKPGTSK